MMLAIGEEACQFEHRDLHWGNILIQRQPQQPPAFRLRWVLLCVRDSLLAKILTVKDQV
jgi:hypothetical protein